MGADVAAHMGVGSNEAEAEETRDDCGGKDRRRVGAIADMPTHRRFIRGRMLMHQ
jgi:hypothetical protein